MLRPLKQLESSGVSTTVIRCDRQGRISVKDIRAAVRTNTRMIVITAASNVTGTRMPLEEIGRIALRNGILFMVDGAQGAGYMDLDVRRNHIDLLAVPGHKGLMGPQGTGFLYVKKGLELTPLVEGGTGTKSKELEQPRDFPEGFEAGTLNAPGIIGLGASIRMIDRIGVSAIRDHEERLVRKLQRGLEGITGVTVYGPEDPGEKAAIVAVNIDGIDCETAAAILDERFGIAVRAGFHCSGLAHDTIGTGDIGCIRLCPGLYTSERDIGTVTDAVTQLAALSAMRKTE